MVDPTPDAEYDAAIRRLLLWFVLAVGVSAMITAYYSGATVLEVGILGLAGVLVGGACLLALGVRP